MIERTREDVDVGPLDKLLNHFKGASVAGNMKRRPVFAATRLLEVESLYLLLLKNLVD